MRSQKECAPTVESQGANGMQPPRIIARFCDSWGITPRMLLADVVLAAVAVAVLSAALLVTCALVGAVRQ